MKENNDGAAMCHSVIQQKQIASGQYATTPEPIDIRESLTDKFSTKPLLSITFTADVPQWLSFDPFLVLMVLKNVIDNAMVHGKSNGAISMDISRSASQLIITLTNEPGEKHDENLLLQSTQGENSLISNCGGNVAHSALIGAEQSTMLGMSEVASVAHLLDADVAVKFLPETVIFTFKIGLVVASNPGAAKLPPDTIMICADDDYTSRQTFKGIMKQKCLNLDLDNSAILGETYYEANRLSEFVMRVASVYADDRLIICIFDQNMDQYPEGTVYGTDVTKELRHRGFNGPIFIRSANDDFASAKKYRDAGATGNLNKGLIGKPAALDIASQWKLTCLKT